MRKNAEARVKTMEGSEVGSNGRRIITNRLINGCEFSEIRVCKLLAGSLPVLPFKAIRNIHACRAEVREGGSSVRAAEAIPLK
jgi:hypothetical protein